MQSIQDKVMEAYPVTAKEKTCAAEKQRNNELRELLKQRLEREFNDTEKGSIDEKVGR